MEHAAGAGGSGPALLTNAVKTNVFLIRVTAAQVMSERWPMAGAHGPDTWLMHQGGQRAANKEDRGQVRANR